MAYRIGNIPADAPDWLVRELRALQEAQATTSGLIFETLYVQPKKLFEGLTVKADGVSFNPGSGAGTYQYRGGAWRFLG